LLQLADPKGVLFRYIAEKPDVADLEVFLTRLNHMFHEAKVQSSRPVLIESPFAIVFHRDEKQRDSAPVEGLGIVLSGRVSSFADQVDQGQITIWDHLEFCFRCVCLFVFILLTT